MAKSLLRLVVIKSKPLPCADTMVQETKKSLLLMSAIIFQTLWLRLSACATETSWGQAVAPMTLLCSSRVDNSCFHPIPDDERKLIKADIYYLQEVLWDWIVCEYQTVPSESQHPDVIDLDSKDVNEYKMCAKVKLTIGDSLTFVQSLCLLCLGKSYKE